MIHQKLDHYCVVVLYGLPGRLSSVLSQVFAMSMDFFGFSDVLGFLWIRMHRTQDWRLHGSN
jgi:hypothetical protein